MYTPDRYADVNGHTLTEHAPSDFYFTVNKSLALLLKSKKNYCQLLYALICIIQP